MSEATLILTGSVAVAAGAAASGVLSASLLFPQPAAIMTKTSSISVYFNDFFICAVNPHFYIVVVLLLISLRLPGH
ncbi:hypothetical protein D3C73_1466620 [compost metagenome]